MAIRGYASRIGACGCGGETGTAWNRNSEQNHCI
jgi:hypothetical protein